ncbi:MAG: FMN-binding protein [Microlunatus sp.]|nr:FMN-binding protein [Microlunatus sp.]
MRRIAMWLAGTATIVILLFGYHTSTNRGTVGPVGSGSAPGIPSGAGASGGAPRDPSRSSHRAPKSKHHKHSHGTNASKSKSTTASATAQTFTGQTAQTYRGPVQVSITVRAGKIIKVDVPVHPNADAQSQMINAYAVPLLVHETMSAQSDKIDMISGATITSGGYVQSLQSALDKAGI